MTNDLRSAVREAEAAIEQIAERLVTKGVPLWDAMAWAREIYQRQQQKENSRGK